MKKGEQALAYYADKFGADSNQWNVEQWRTVATELARQMDSPVPSVPVPRGRPQSAGNFASAQTNYLALAWQVKEQMEASNDTGKTLEIKSAVEQIMRESAAKNSLRGERVDAKLETAYTAVRKILKTWSTAAKAEKK